MIQHICAFLFYFKNIYMHKCIYLAILAFLMDYFIISVTIVKVRNISTRLNNLIMYEVEKEWWWSCICLRHNVLTLILWELCVIELKIKIKKNLVTFFESPSRNCTKTAFFFSQVFIKLIFVEQCIFCRVLSHYQSSFLIAK